MRILVLTEEGDGVARVRESREIFDVNEFRLSYTCPNCKNEFIFHVDKPPAQKWTTCPMCPADLKTESQQKLHPQVLLWEALSMYGEFCKFVTQNQLSLKLMVTTKEPKSVGAENKAPESR